MLTESVSVKLGPQLGFNDLPTSITVEFTLANARPLGLQEIMGKFNSGYLRTVDVQKSYYETKTLPGTGDSRTEPLGLLPLEDINVTTTGGSSGSSGTSGTSGAAGSTTPTNATGAASGSSGTSGTSGTSGAPKTLFAGDNGTGTGNVA